MIPKSTFKVWDSNQTFTSTGSARHRYLPQQGPIHDVWRLFESIDFLPQRCPMESTPLCNDASFYGQQIEEPHWPLRWRHQQLPEERRWSESRKWKQADQREAADALSWHRFYFEDCFLHRLQFVQRRVSLTNDIQLRQAGPSTFSSY